ncbi:MAG: GNAT family N-acetyltransferase [Wenzhouxiangella sp.]|nr:GNAT family N-acetyltransferase [Wenzhouxiangella sp.]TVR95031.1 MAG: GNAT family N-acetyltransferase [Wenzhouxiangellaceae bacterium]
MTRLCTIRAAKRGDEALLLELIRELAVYERLENEVVADESLLGKALFGPEPIAHALIAKYGGEAAGFALYFFNFSTFLGRPGLYLEDLFVREPLRGHGIGKALLLHLAGLAHQRGCGRMEWCVLDWNQPAIDFYRSLGAVPMDEWTVFRLDRGALESLAGPKR